MSTKTTKTLSILWWINSVFKLIVSFFSEKRTDKPEEEEKEKN